MRAAWWGASGADRRARGRSERGRGDARCGAGRARLGQRGEVRVWAARERVEVWAQARAAVGRRGREKRRMGRPGKRRKMGPHERWVRAGLPEVGPGRGFFWVSCFWVWAGILFYYFIYFFSYSN